MIRLAISIVILVAFSLLGGCTDLLGTDVPDVRVVANIEPDRTVSYVVENDSPERIILDVSPCAASVQHREGGKWRFPVQEHPCASVLLLAWIEAGDEYTSERWDAADWPPGEYRFVLPLSKNTPVSSYPEGAERLPAEARTSNAFQIE